MKLVLADGSEINYIFDHNIGEIYTEFDTETEVNAAKNKLTPKNLKTVQIYDEENNLSMHLTNVVLLAFEENFNIETNKYEVYIRLHDKTEEEIMDETINLLQSIQEIQNGAIEDLGMVLSEILGG